MKNLWLPLILLGELSTLAYSQNYKPVIEPCPCLMKVDSRLKTRCGYLVVPENRAKPKGNQVKISFLFAWQPLQDSTKNILLHTAGGPGYATINAGDSLKYNADYFAYGGVVLFDQRGTKNTQPCLDCEGINEATREAYRKNVSSDSLKMIAITKCREKFIKNGIDLSAYNEVESAADIADLRKVLNIDSMILLGISYSGGLMLNVARNHPKGIKALLLNSPLPSYVNYEEHALFNHNEALEQLFNNVAADTVLNTKFPHLKSRFQNYFIKISGKRFVIKYYDTEQKDSIDVEYGKNELLDAVFFIMNNRWVSTVPQTIDDLVTGKHQVHITKVLNSKFRGDNGISYGMRLSLYCSGQIAHSDPLLVKKQDEILPWLAQYPFNSPTHQTCNCWKVKPVANYIKEPVYSTIPTLVSQGALDIWTRPHYSQTIKRTMPNAQAITVLDRTHVAGFGNGILNQFMANPYQKVVSSTKNVVVE